MKSEWVEAIRDGRWERVENGILLPAQRVVLNGEYAWSVNARARGRQANLLTNQGLALIASNAWPTPIYGALFANNVTPVAGWTAATFPATAGEITSAVEGYVEAARVQWDGAPYMEFNIRTATTLTVYGFGLSTVNTKGSTSGSLVSAMRFTAGVELFDNRDILDVRYTITTTPV